MNEMKFAKGADKTGKTIVGREEGDVHVTHPCGHESSTSAVDVFVARISISVSSPLLISDIKSLSAAVWNYFCNAGKT